jgi:serine/threonine protein kinase
LGLRKLWQGRDDRDSSAGESQDEISPRPSSDHSRKQDNLTRRLSRKVGVGLHTPFKRQSSDLERLAPREPDHRRALSADRRPLSSHRTSPPAVGPRQSAPEVQWLGPPTTTVEFDNFDSQPEPHFEPNDAPEIDQVSEDWNPYPEMATDNLDAREENESIDLDMELEQRWILNLSMHFRDRSEREKFFVTYAETPNRWRRVTISCDYRDAPPDSLEEELKGLRYQRDKCARIYESIRESLLAIQFYEGVTNLRLETSGGRLHVHVTEDVNETIPYPPISSIGHLDGAPWIPEHLLHFESHLSGFVYKINLNGRFFIKKEIPGPDTVDEFLYEINALHALKGRPSVIQVEGIVVDERRGVVKGLLISYAEQGALVDILYERRGRTSFARRERWAKQIVQGLCEIHESGYVQGDFTLANIVVDAEDNAKIIDINRRGCPVGWEPPEIAAKIESNQRISMYIGVKTDLFQLGMTLWALAMEEDEPERQPRPLRLGDDTKIPDYYRRIVDICLSPVPRHRLSAKDLLAMFPPLPATRASTPIRPLETMANDPRFMSVRSNWMQPQPAGLGLSSPGGMMQHDDDFYPRKEFSEPSYDGLQHPIFPENHDLVKRSTITLAGSNEDMGFSSKPSSTSTLNHDEQHNHGEYMDYSCRINDESSPYPPFDNQNLQSDPGSHEIPMGNGFHDHRLEPSTLPGERPYNGNYTMDNQRETAREPSYDQTPAMLSSHITTPTPPVAKSHAEPQRQQVLNRPIPKTGNDAGDLVTSALPINPTLCDTRAPSVTQSTLLLATPSSIKLPKQETLDQPCAKASDDEVDLESSALPLSPSFRDSGNLNAVASASLSMNASHIKPPKQEHATLPCANAGDKPKPTEPSPSTSSLSASGLPISPTFRSSGTLTSAPNVPSSKVPSLKLPKQDYAVQPPAKTSKIKHTTTMPSDSQPPSTSPIDPTLIRSWPSIDFDTAPQSAKPSPVEASKQEFTSLPHAEPSPSTSYLSRSELPISPAFRSPRTSLGSPGVPSSQCSTPVESSKQKNSTPPTNESKPTSTGSPSPTSARFSSALHMSSLRHTGASIGSMGTAFTGPSVVGIGLLRRPWESSSANTADVKPVSTKPPGPSSSPSSPEASPKPTSTNTPVKPSLTEPQRNEPLNKPGSKPTETRPARKSPSESTPNLLASNLPISPAHLSPKPNSLCAEAKAICPPNNSASSPAKPSRLSKTPLSPNRK